MEVRKRAAVFSFKNSKKPLLSGTELEMVKEEGKMKKMLFIFLMIMAFTFVLASPYAESQEPSKPPIVIAVDGLYLGEIGPKGIEPLKSIEPQPNGYLAGALKESRVFKSMNAEIKPYSWSRDPADTKKVVADLKTNIVQAYEVAENDKRPLIIVGHSWGSVLAHEALSELAKGKIDDLTDERMKRLAKKGVKVDSFITMGSPLAAGARTDLGSIPASVLMGVETPKEGLERSYNKDRLPDPKKPENVTGEWVNYWAKGDLFSGAIPALGDKNNIQIDKGQEPSPLHPIQNTEKWHKAYFMPQGADWKRDDSFKSVYVDKDGLVVDPGKDRLPVPTKTSEWLDDAGVKGLTNYSSVTEYDSAQLKKLSNMLEEKLETSPKEKQKEQTEDKGKEKTGETKGKIAAQPAPSAKEGDKQKAEEPKPGVAKKGEPIKTVIKNGEEPPTIVTLETKKETPSASSSENPKQAAVTPKTASPNAAKRMPLKYPILKAQ